MKVYGYGRVSTEIQEKNGASLVVQKTICQKWFEQHSKTCESEWGGWFEDPARSAVTTGFFDRPAAKQILDLVKPGDLIVGLDQTRMFRTMSDTEESIELLNRLGVRIAFARTGNIVDTTSPTGRLMYRIQAATSSFEVETLKLRCQESYRNRQQMGMVVDGTIPIGWERRYRVVEGKKTPYYHPNQHDRDLAKMIWSMNVEEKIPIRGLVLLLSRSHHRRSTGAKLNSFHVVRRFIKAYEFGFPDTHLIEPNPDYKPNEPGAKKTRLKRFPSVVSSASHASQ